jgi:hypothetical protein
MTEWRFWCEMKPEITLPPAYSFPQAFNYLNPDRNSFYILERDGRDYIQCGGEKRACTVEVRRFRPDGTYSHSVVGHAEGDPTPTTIQMSAGGVTVETREVLTHWEAIDLFTCFYEHREFPAHYRLRDVEGCDLPGARATS